MTLENAGWARLAPAAVPVGMPQTCWRHAVANIQVKNVPEELHRRLRRSARKRRTTLREVILSAIERELSHEEFIARLRRRPSVDLGQPAAELLREVRAERQRG